MYVQKKTKKISQEEDREDLAYVEGRLKMKASNGIHGSNNGRTSGLTSMAATTREKEEQHPRIMM